MQQYISNLHNGCMSVNELDIPQLRSLVEEYPYYHQARLMLLRMLFLQRDPAFNDELRRSALFVPSRETIFDFVEGEKMKPKVPAESTFFGATQSRKENESLNEVGNRVELLIDSFLSSNTPAQKSIESAPIRRGRVDASVDYISYMLAEEEENARDVSEEILPQTTLPVSESEALIDNFIQNTGERRIRLQDKADNELQKPVLDVGESSNTDTFTETLARIYIKQGKFEQAIEIIRRLSLKNPKKNRYFADQIRFLEKLIANQNVLKR